MFPGHCVSRVHDALGPIAQLLVVHASVICGDKHEIEAFDYRLVHSIDFFPANCEFSRVGLISGTYGS